MKPSPDARHSRPAIASPAAQCPIDHEAAERAARALPGPVRRAVFLGVGSLSVSAGIIGIVVPLWPTTCFLLLAAWCFARSSPRAERWLYENRLFGRYLAAYRERGVISTRVRRGATIFLWSAILVSAVFAAGQLWLVALLLLVAALVTAHLYSLPGEG
ncbi:MAG: YbaN family protein [Gemmatimonadetes bacterium]|nr:YbaN family protein [Candidatus Palauibacter australiensis]